MKLNFCTLFDANYLSRGLAMYQSLSRHCNDFHLYVYAFDEVCFNYFNEHEFNNLTVISLKDFENEDLLRIKPTRTAGEYCWTCSSSSIYHSIVTFNLNNCTYVDADMLFYANPKVLIEEMNENSVLIIPHRYSAEYDQTTVSGRFCVQFMTFKNTEEGMRVLEWWKDACIEWCFARVEDGKFGDQKYVDEFQKRFTGVHELKHLGGGVAPWNLQQYKFEQNNGKLFGTETSTREKFEVVFFHFHGLKFHDSSIVNLTGSLYELNSKVKSLFYFPYISILNHLKNSLLSNIQHVDVNGNAGAAPAKPLSLLLILKIYLSGIKHHFLNIFGQDLAKRIAHHHFFYYK